MGKYSPQTKLVYLDQKDWITLSRGYYGRSSETIRRVTNLVLKASDKETAIFPLSLVHLDETLRNLNPKRRIRLASFMVKVSKGYAILPSTSLIMEAEVRQATLKKLGLPTTDLRKYVIGRGISHMLGTRAELKRKEGTVGPDLTEENKRKILGYIESPDALLFLLTSQSLAEESQQITQMHASVVKKMEEIRRRSTKIIDKDLRYRASLAEFLIDPIGKWLAKLHVELNLPKDAIVRKDWTKKDYMEFFETMPTAYCLFTLAYRRDQYLQRPIDKNDINDIAALSIAIPYCDIVVTESMWASISKQSKLDKKYNTLILSSVKQLEDRI